VSALRDERGCLTPDGIAAVQKAPVGQAPAELATHLASCARCQERLLAGGAAALALRKKKVPPPPWRLAVVLALAVGLVLMVLVSLSRLNPGN
jgi:hypothetical protein